VTLDVTVERGFAGKVLVADVAAKWTFLGVDAAVPSQRRRLKSNEMKVKTDS